MKKNTKRFLMVTSTVIAGMYIYNRIVSNAATRKNMLSTKNGAYYSWKLGNVFYTKVGNGKPILLIHDTDTTGSSAEWAKVVKRLQKKHTVYTIDLLGCGLSDKPKLTYTNYMYVQLISSFIKDVVGEKTDLAATHISASFALMVKQMEPDFVDHLILINPLSLKSLTLAPDCISKWKQTIINLPLVGTFVYNVLMNPSKMNRRIRSAYFANEKHISANLQDTYYQAAHMDESSGKYLYSSLCGKYLNGDIRHAVQKMEDGIYLITSSGIKGNRSIIEEYRKNNPKTEVTQISDCKLYPQLEIPEKVCHIIDKITL